MGFSAGGHLCALTVHQYDLQSYQPIDDIDAVDCKPNFAILIYPAYLEKESAPSGRVGLVKDTDISIFIAISRNDVFLDGTDTYAHLLNDFKADYEYHVYRSGGHGTGLGGFPWTETWEADRDRPVVLFTIENGSIQQIGMTPEEFEAIEMAKDEPHVDGGLFWADQPRTRKNIETKERLKYTIK